MKSIRKSGYSQPTPIQAQVHDDDDEGRINFSVALMVMSKWQLWRQLGYISNHRASVG